MAAPNIVNVATITGKTAVQAVTTTPADIVTNAAASNTVVKINSLTFSNINSSSPVTVIASIFRSSTEFKIAQNISIPISSTFIAIDKPTSIYLEEGDSLRLTASANSSLHAVCSYEIIG
jgi:hypothetical protein